jgi:formylglycine-generating enzyme
VRRRDAELCLAAERVVDRFTHLGNRLMRLLHTSALIALTAIVITFMSPAQAITIDLVTVGNIGNAPDPATGDLFGDVSYEYFIATTEVTNAQYVAFLNAKAASDPLELYNTNMDSDPRGGITRTGVDGGYTYDTKANMADKPVNYVSWYDAIRFSNWMNNGQGAGDTESGAYTLLGGTPTPSNGLSITRNPGASWVLPSDNEWYKAAYHQPQAQGGDTDDYWLYPTATNTDPTMATAGLTGDIDNPGANVANYNDGADWNSLNGNVTTVGSAGLLSASFYGTLDQGGNVWEWNEALISGTYRGLRGGSYESVTASQLSTGLQNVGLPTDEFYITGFRVVAVPEPSTMALGFVAVAGIAFHARRRRTRASRNSVASASSAFSRVSRNGRGVVVLLACAWGLAACVSSETLSATEFRLESRVTASAFYHDANHTYSGEGYDGSLYGDYGVFSISREAAVVDGPGPVTKSLSESTAYVQPVLMWGQPTGNILYRRTVASADSHASTSTYDIHVRSSLATTFGGHAWYDSMNQSEASALYQDVLHIDSAHKPDVVRIYIGAEGRYGAYHNGLGMYYNMPTGYVSMTGRGLAGSAGSTSGVSLVAASLLHVEGYSRYSSGWFTVNDYPDIGSAYAGDARVFNAILEVIVPKNVYTNTYPLEVQYSARSSANGEVFRDIATSAYAELRSFSLLGVSDNGSSYVSLGGLYDDRIDSSTVSFASGAMIAPVPEPSTWVMGLAGLACGGWQLWRRRRSA